MKLTDIFLATVLLLAACNDKKPQPPVIPQLGCVGWTINPLVNGVAYGPLSCSDSGSFTFPVCPSPPSRTDGTHTLVRPSGLLVPGATVTADFEIVGAGAFVGAQEQASGAMVSLFLQRAGDNWSGAGPYTDYRAYSIKDIPLSNGRYQLSVPLVRDQWTSVQDPGTEQGFAELLQNVERIGVVFGTYQSGRAHGVCPDNASSQFILHGYVVQ
jgi:hypothetical protein